MMGGNVKMALASIRSSRLRSLLTMLGIIIGVMSVMLTVALTEGLRSDTARQIKATGSNYIQVRPGDFAKRDITGKITGYDISAVLASSISLSPITDHDIESLQQLKDLQYVAPVALINSSLRYEANEVSRAVIVTTNSKYPLATTQDLLVGDFVTDTSKDAHLAVIGSELSKQVFGSRSPLGETLTIRGIPFTIRGVMKQREAATALDTLGDFNHAVFINQTAGREITQGELRYQQVSILARENASIPKTVDAINETFRANHNGELNVTTITQADSLSFASSVVSLTARFTTAVMSISLLVAGIGIMNIMLVSVTERTREIGIRKSIGATNRQILAQFFVEAFVLGLYGGVIGVIASWATSVLVNTYSHYKLVPTMRVTLISLGLAAVVGSFFGIAPALKAARKDPIQALRGA